MANPPHTVVYSPWTATTDEAIARIKTEMTMALSALQARTAAAGKLLDTAYSTAAGPAAQMRAAAFTAFHTWMMAADNYAKGIIDPAVAAYDKEIADATADYDAALADAVKTYNKILAAADSAKNETAKLPKTA